MYLEEIRIIKNEYKSDLKDKQEELDNKLAGFTYNDGLELGRLQGKIEMMIELEAKMVNGKLTKTF